MRDSAAPITAMHSAKICSTLPIFLHTAYQHQHSGCLGKALDHVLFRADVIVACNLCADEKIPPSTFLM